MNKDEFDIIRQAKLNRFTFDRLMSILSGFGQDVEITVKTHPRPAKRAASELRL